MDKQLRAEIVATVRQTMQEVLENADEVWLTPKGVVENFGMITKEWMRKNAELLPRELASVVFPNGTEVSTHWAYPKHRINRMIQEGKLRGLLKQTNNKNQEL